MSCKKCCCSNFLELTRGYTLPMSIAPWFVAVCYCAFARPDIKDIILTFIAISCLHLAVNLLDDYKDVKSKLAQGLKLSEICFKSGKNKAGLIINGTYSMEEVAFIIFILFAIAFIIGLHYTVICGLIIPLIAIPTLILCLLYPKATKNGWGEAIIGILFAPLLTYGVYTVLTSYYPFDASYMPLGYLSISIALLTIALAHTHSIMDWEFDVNNGKKTLCTIFKTKPNAVYTLGVLVFLAYLNILYLIFFGILPFGFVWVFLTLPIAIKLVKSMDDYINIRDVEFKPQWYLGCMENWKKIVEDKNAYFMFRFYLARNLAFWFSFIAGLVFYATVASNFYFYIF